MGLRDWAGWSEDLMDDKVAPPGRNDYFIRKGCWQGCITAPCQAWMKFYRKACLTLFCYYILPLEC